MSKQYKRKLYIECNDTDKNHRQDIRKNLNSSERQQGKLEAMSALETYEHVHSHKFIVGLRWELELKLSKECWDKEINCMSVGLATLLKKLNIGCFNLHKCNCILPEKLSDKEILNYFGY